MQATNLKTQSSRYKKTYTFKNDYLQFILLLIYGCFFFTGCIADLRTSSIKKEKDLTSLKSMGKRILGKALEVHGVGEGWQKKQSLTLVMEDHWQGLMGKMGNPWPEARQKLKMELRVGTFDARVTFLSGQKKDWVWGIQSWKTYKQQPEKEVTFSQDNNIKFNLAAFQYLIEFPLRASRIPIAAYGGKETVRGVTYHIVLSTWKSFEPSVKYDQYKIYIREDNHRIEIVQYTVREFMRFMSATMRFSDFRKVGEVQLPFKYTVTGGPSDDPKSYIHEIQVESARWNKATKNTFRVNPKLRPMGEMKPHLAFMPFLISSPTETALAVLSGKEW